jgi:hypothetical protein
MQLMHRNGSLTYGLQFLLASQCKLKHAKKRGLEKLSPERFILYSCAVPFTLLESKTFLIKTMVLSLSHLCEIAIRKKGDNLGKYFI